MKLTIINGIIHDLAHHLEDQILFGYYKDHPKERITNILEEKDSFDKMCAFFFKERLTKSFDFKRIKKINIEILRSLTTLTISIKVKVDDNEFKYQLKSMMTQK